MGFVGGALGDPLAEGLNFGGGEWVAVVGWGHGIVFRGDSLDEEAVVWVSGNGGGLYVFWAFLGQSFKGVEAEVGPSFVWIGSVASEAVFGEDGANVLVEGDFCEGRSRDHGEGKADEFAEHVL